MAMPTWVNENKQIIAAALGGVMAIIAAFIRRDKSSVSPVKKKPRRRGLLWCLLGLGLGAACLVAEALYFPINPDTDDMTTENLGEILVLAGCVLVAAGLIWGVINVCRLLLWKKPEDVSTPDIPETPATVPLSPPFRRHREE